MKNKLGKIITFLVAAMLGTIFFIFTGCQYGEGNNDANEEQKIELTLNNFEQYLSIDKTVTDSGSLAGGSYRYVSYKVTIYGAIDGLYQDCVLYYKIGNGEEREIKLNVAGYATFNYRKVNGNDLTYTKAGGTILL